MSQDEFESPILRRLRIWREQEQKRIVMELYCKTEMIKAQAAADAAKPQAVMNRKLGPFPWGTLYGEGAGAQY